MYGHKAYYLDSKKGSLTPAFIVKHSFNLIDLIEVGDYVNGKLVNDIEKFEDGTIYIKFSEHDYISDIEVEKIKSIVTHEQFKSVMYEV